MRIFPVDHKFVTTVACLALAIASLPSHAVDFGDVVAGCAGFFSPYKVYRGRDADLVDKWIVLSDRNPRLAQVSAAGAAELTVRWINYDTMVIETFTVPRPRNIYLANDKALAAYHVGLRAASVRQTQRDVQLIGRVVSLSGGIGPARVVSASPKELEIEYVPSRTMRVERMTIRRPPRLDILADVDFGDIVANAGHVAAAASVRPGNYVYWSPNAPMSSNGSSITVQYARPVRFPYRQSLFRDLQERGLLHAHVAEVDLVKGKILLTSNSWAIRLPIRSDILARSGFLLSPVGVLDQLPPQKAAGFRAFRNAFLYDNLQAGTAVLGFSGVGGDPLKNPREDMEDLRYYRIVTVGPDFVTLRTNDEFFRAEGAWQLAHLSLHSTILNASAEVLVRQHEGMTRQSSRPTNRFEGETLNKMPYLKDLGLITNELVGRGFEVKQIFHYAVQISQSGDIKFWTGTKSRADEYKSILLGLHASKLTNLSQSTRDFAAELYARATSAGRTLRGYSERR